MGSDTNCLLSSKQFLDLILLILSRLKSIIQSLTKLLKFVVLILSVLIEIRMEVVWPSTLKVP